MIKIIPFLLSFATLPIASASQPPSLNCEFRVMEVPLVRLNLSRSESGEEWNNFVEIEMLQQGTKHKESFTPESPQESEFLRAWISKESEENSLMLIIYSTNSESSRKAVLVNSRVPFGKEMHGACREL